MENDEFLKAMGYKDGDTIVILYPRVDLWSRILRFFGVSKWRTQQAQIFIPPKTQTKDKAP